MSTPDYSRTKLVSREQVNRLWELIGRTDEESYPFFEQFGINLIEFLPADQFDAALQWLYRRINRCTACNGKGTCEVNDGHQYVQCSECGGKGVL